MRKSFIDKGIQRSLDVRPVRLVRLKTRDSLRTACALLSVFALSAAVLAQDAPPPAAEGPPAGKVLIVQESNGFPGGEQATELSRQQVLVIDGRLRVHDPAHGWALFVSLPDRKVQEASVNAREYVEHTFSYYEKYRTDRAKAIAEQASEFRKHRHRLKDNAGALRELETEYTRMGGDIREPGKIVARLEPFPQDTRKVKLLVDRKEQEVTLEHYRIRENNATDPVFDLWITRDLALPVDVLAFWRALGTFAPEVSAKLQQVPGVVIECNAFLDTGTFKKRFQSRVLEIRTQDPALDPQAVALPAGFQKVEPGERNQEQAPQVWCVMTGRMLEPGREVVFIGPDGRKYTLADGQQRLALIKLLGEKKEPPFLRGPASAPPGTSGPR